MESEEFDNLYPNWVNGNLSDVVNALLKTDKLSAAIEFALLLDPNDANTLIRMLRNRDK